MKKTLAIATAALTMALSAMPALAATNVTEYNSFTSNGSYIGTAVIDRTSVINANGGNIRITDVDETNINNSVVDTLVKSGTKVYSIKGRNIDMAAIDTTTVNGSAIGTYVDQKIKDINTRSW